MPVLRRFLPAAPLFLAILVLALSFPKTASADLTGSLIPLGPDGGTIGALAVDPLDVLTVYAGGSDNGGGVFKTSDGGITWEPQRNGMPLGASVLGLAVDPARHATIYAGTFGLGIYKSTDGGASWSQRNQGLNTNNQFYTFAVLPASPDTVLAGSELGVYRSLDAGAHWVLAGQGLPSTPAVRAALAVSPTAVYAAVVSSGVFKSLNGGASWSAVNGGLPAGADVSALAISKPDGALYAAVAQHGVFRSLDGGAHWSAASGGLAGSLFVHSLAVDPGAPATVFAATNHGIFRSDDRGANWTAAVTGLTSLDVPALAAPQTGLLYAGTASVSAFQVSAGGVFQSSDGGRSWQRRSQGISILFIAAMAVEPTTPTTLWATTSAGIFRSGDGGGTWSLLDPGVAGVPITVAVDQDRPGNAYVVLSSSAGAALVFTADAGRTWSRLPTPAGASFLDVSLDPRSHSLFIGGFGVFRSTDGGQTWTAAAGVNTNDDIAGDAGLRVVPDPSTSGVLYAAGERPNGPHLIPPPQARVFKSTDGGVTWTRSDAGLEGVTDIARLVVLPNAPAVLYGLSDDGRIFRSRNAGASWELAAQALPARPLDLVAAADGTLFAATQGAGVLTSTDGQTWTPIEGVPTQFSAGSLLIDPHNPRLLYVGTSATGVQALALATPSVCPSGATSATALCLQGRRFQVEVAWSDFTGRTGAGQAVPGIDPTGSFWFFDPSNTELVIKALDGRIVNGHFWVFYASLTNIAYTLKITDTETGVVRIYRNPLGHFGSAGDVEAF